MLTFDEAYENLKQSPNPKESVESFAYEVVNNPNFQISINHWLEWIGKGRSKDALLSALMTGLAIGMRMEKDLG
jgi:hypothetical protein